MYDVVSKTTLIKCLIGDDHEVVRAGLKLLLERQDGIDVVGQAADGAEVVGMIERRRPDVAIVDMRMPRYDGIEICHMVAEASLNVPVIVYTGYSDVNILEEALDAGARGYVLKSSPPPDLVRAVRLVAEGETYVDSTLVSALVNRRAREERLVLSPRETEVLQLLANGLTTEAAAERLFLSPTTVRSYGESAMAKLETRNRTHAVARALRLHLIE